MISKHQKTSLLKLLYTEKKQTALWARRAVEPVLYSLFSWMSMGAASKLGNLLASVPSCLKILTTSKTFFSYVSTLPAQRWKCRGHTLTFVVQNNLKCRKRWWMGNYKLWIASGFHILGIFKVPNLENVHCCQSWPQTLSIGCKWRFYDFNVCTHCLSHIAS